MRIFSKLFLLAVLLVLTTTTQACDDTGATDSAVATLPDHGGAATTSDPVPNGVTTADFTIKAGAVLEVLYFNLSDKAFAKTTKAYAKAAEKSGGELLAQFRVIKKKTDRPVTHIAIVQWADPSGYAKTTDEKLREGLVDVGFFGAQADTPVSLRDDKIYDFTSAWTIATDPCQMPAIMNVMGTYFGKVGPVLGKYGIAQTAFVGPYPGAPATSAKVYDPHMMGIFQWNQLSDVDKFQNDADFTAHVDIRNAVMSKMEYIYTKAIL